MCRAKNGLIWSEDGFPDFSKNYLFLPWNLVLQTLKITKKDLT